MTEPSADWLRTLLDDALGEPVTLVGAWVDPPVAPPIRDATVVRAVFAYPALRLATLRHWRDTVELVSESEPGTTVHVVAHEASKWARLVMKAHPGTLAIAAEAPTLDSDGVLSGPDGLVALARSIAELDDPAEAGSLLEGGSAMVSPGERFEALERWLIRVRDHAGGKAKRLR